MDFSDRRFVGPPPNSSVRVLEISDDPSLASTRFLLLRDAGFLIEQAHSFHVRAAEKLGHFDVVLLCQSIGPQKAAELVSRIRRELPFARILRVRSRRADHDDLANLTITAPARPDELIQAVEFLARTAPSRPPRTLVAGRSEPF